MNDICTNFVCKPTGDSPSGWGLAAILAIPVVLVVLDFLR